MTPTPSDHEPLDPTERELARVLRALPGGEPSPALDARVLKAASDAVAAEPPARRLGWLAASGPLWSIGSAAAAVLAIGIAWQVYSPVPRTLAPTSPVPVSAPLDHDAPLEVQFRDRVGPTTAPPPPAATRQAPAAKSAPAAAAPAASAAPARNVLDEAVPHEPTPFPAAPAMAPAPQAEALASPTMAAQRAAPMAKSSSAEHAADAATEVAGAAPAGGIDADTLARIRSDARRYPESWLLKVRARRDEGDLAGARASLQLFHRTYPTHPVPDDLQPLLAP